MLCSFHNSESGVNVLDIFSGIGGFSLGLERAGMRTVQFVELDPYCRAILAERWPNVPRHDDIRTFNSMPCDVICGGFPCQDISDAGKGIGIEGNRSGLWREFRRLLEEIRPQFAIIENVSALRGRGLARVLSDLAAIGFDAEWSTISACSVGAPHPRDRVFIVAYAAGRWREQRRWIEFEARRYQTRNIHHWKDQPEPPRVADGISARMDRNKALGNAIVPQIAEIIGRAIMQQVTSNGKQT